MINIEEIKRFLIEYTGPKIKLMEVCGTHTGSIVKNGIRSLLSPSIKLVSGPGCPVCVTPSNYIDLLMKYAESKKYAILTFGDLIRVPGTKASLSEAKASGGSVEIIYSPMDAVEIALNNSEKNYVLAAVGFETTIPAYALLLDKLTEMEITNVKLFTSLKTIGPALDWLCKSEPDIDGFIAPGHVASVTGTSVYNYLANKYHKPFCIAGFSAEHILVAIYDLVVQTSNARHEVHNLYRSIVSDKGNPKAMKIIEKYFEPSSVYWRGIGVIDHSGYVLRKAYMDYTIEFPSEEKAILKESNGCRCGEVIIGRIEPKECPLFGKVCTPVNPIGPCMVSHEGTCGIHYNMHE
ncbi:MAG: hydrogenase formation protein HypD [Clostridiaceae bacterium]|jgi:hydrogenase expression/formation protein HypD|nr:hydrogenase formation protein HypD [Clostridiaceae bacterium]